MICQFFKRYDWGYVFTTELLKRIKSPLLLNYIHASRYGEATFGSSHVTWYRQPNTDEIRGKMYLS